jgi:hypothetical protein
MKSIYHKFIKSFEFQNGIENIETSNKITVPHYENIIKKEDNKKNFINKIIKEVSKKIEEICTNINSDNEDKYYFLRESINKIKDVINPKYLGIVIHIVYDTLNNNNIINIIKEFREETFNYNFNFNYIIKSDNISQDNFASKYNTILLDKFLSFSYYNNKNLLNCENIKNLIASNLSKIINDYKLYTQLNRILFDVSSKNIYDIFSTVDIDSLDVKNLISLLPSVIKMIKFNKNTKTNLNFNNINTNDSFIKKEYSRPDKASNTPSILSTYKITKNEDYLAFINYTTDNIPIAIYNICPINSNEISSYVYLFLVYFKTLINNKYYIPDEGYNIKNIKNINNNKLESIFKPIYISYKASDLMKNSIFNNNSINIKTRLLSFSNAFFVYRADNIHKLMINNNTKLNISNYESNLCINSRIDKKENANFYTQKHSKSDLNYQDIMLSNYDNYLNKLNDKIFSNFNLNFYSYNIIYRRYVNILFSTSCIVRKFYPNIKCDIEKIKNVYKYTFTRAREVTSRTRDELKLYAINLKLNDSIINNENLLKVYKNLNKTCDLYNYLFQNNKTYILESNQESYFNSLDLKLSLYPLITANTNQVDDSIFNKLDSYNITSGKEEDSKTQEQPSLEKIIKGDDEKFKDVFFMNFIFFRESTTLDQINKEVDKAYSEKITSYDMLGYEGVIDVLRSKINTSTKNKNRIIEENKKYNAFALCLEGKKVPTKISGDCYILCPHSYSISKHNINPVMGINKCNITYPIDIKNTYGFKLLSPPMIDIYKLKYLIMPVHQHKLKSDFTNNYNNLYFDNITFGSNFSPLAFDMYKHNRNIIKNSDDKNKIKDIEQDTEKLLRNKLFIIYDYIFDEKNDINKYPYVIDSMI